MAEGGGGSTDALDALAARIVAASPELSDPRLSPDGMRPAFWAFGAKLFSPAVQPVCEVVTPTFYAVDSSIAADYPNVAIGVTVEEANANRVLPLGSALPTSNTSEDAERKIDRNSKTKGQFLDAFGVDLLPVAGLNCEIAPHILFADVSVSRHVSLRVRRNCLPHCGKRGEGVTPLPTTERISTSCDCGFYLHRRKLVVRTVGVLSNNRVFAILRLGTNDRETTTIRGESATKIV